MEKKFIENKGKTYYHKGYAHRGWHKESQATLSKNLTKDIKDGLIVEIGVFGGVSILNIAEHCKTNNTKIIGIDPWELTIPNDDNGKKLSTYRFREENLIDARTNLEMICTKLRYDHISLIKDFSHRAVNSFSDLSIDLLYIDGEHTYNAVKMDLDLWYPKMKHKATIWGDDWHIPGVRQAVNEFCDAQKLQYQVEANSFVIKLS